MSTFDVGRKPYFDIKDTVEEVGITRRQLSYWESEGLIEAELGQDSKKYTTQDIRRLKALRHLIVDRNLPFPLVKELVQGSVEDVANFSLLLMETASLFDETSPIMSDSVLDFEKGKIVSSGEIATDWWNRRLAIASEDFVAQKVYELTLLLFRIVRMRLPRTAAFEERKSEIIDHLNWLSTVARLDITKYGEDASALTVSKTPHYPGEELPSASELKHSVLQWASALNPYRDALASGFDPESPQYRAFSQRFWAEEELEGVRELPFDWDPDGVPF